MCECTCSAAVVENGIESSFNRRKRPFVDRRVKAAVFNGPDGKIRGVISSGCCHPVINTTMEISADYLQVLTQRSIEEHGVPFLFLQGRGADVNPCTFEDMDIEEVMEKVGSELADAVACAVRKAGGNQEAIDSVQNIYTPAAIPVKPFETVEEAEKSCMINSKRIWTSPGHWRNTMLSVNWNGTAGCTGRSGGARNRKSMCRFSF